MAKNNDKETPEQKHMSAKNDWRFVNPEPPCQKCVHLISIGEQYSSTRWTCKAFPEGILYGIWARHTRHDKPIPSQVGNYVYKSKIAHLDDGDYVCTFEGEWLKLKK